MFSDNGTEKGTVKKRQMKVIWAQNNNNESNDGTLQEDTRRGEATTTMGTLKKNHEIKGNGVVKNKQTIIARINKQKNTLHVDQTFLYIFSLIRCHHTTITWNFPKTWRFLEDVETTTNFLFAV